MRYTAGKVAKMSGVSAQTLRYYDKIGLLSPAYYAENGYRYYQREQLLQLQQILFFRELGFTLDAVSQLLHSDDFNLLLSLSLQKQKLLDEMRRCQSLVDTIDSTALNLKGDIAMKDEALFNGLTDAKIAEHKAFAENYMADKADAFINEMVQIEKQVSQPQREENLNKALATLAQFKELIEAGAKPTDAAVQALMKRDYEDRIAILRAFSKQEFIEFVRMQVEHPNSRKHFDSIDEKFADFYLEAAICFANKNLKES